MSLKVYYSINYSAVKYYQQYHSTSYQIYSYYLLIHNFLQRHSCGILLVSFTYPLPISCSVMHLPPYKPVLSSPSYNSPTAEHFFSGSYMDWRMNSSTLNCYPPNVTGAYGQMLVILLQLLSGIHSYNILINGDNTLYLSKS